MNSVFEMFLDVVKKYPNKIAIKDKDREYTYSELLEKVKELNSLINKYPKDRAVIVLAGRDIDSVASFLAVISTGNFYIPLDKSLPIIKINSIIDDSCPVCIIGREEDKEIVKELDKEIDFISTSDKSSNDYIFRDSTKDTPLYMVYTSGSTGKPKGVLKSHGAVLSFVSAFSKRFPFEEDTIIGNQTPLFFDASAKDIYLSLYNAATLDIIPSEKFTLPLVLVNYLNERKINWICWVPSALCLISMLNTFKEAKPLYLKNIFFVGEVFPVKQLRKWIENMPGVRFVNLYGSSEIAGICLYYEVKDLSEDIDVLPMGKALDNCSITLRKDGKVITESDVVGEVYIESDALALKYYNNEELTNKVFYMENSKRIFISGDLARYDKDGNLCFVSRKDFQIKHMGRRIELGEIESACDKIENINRCCALYDEKRKVITLFCELNSEISTNDIRNKLKDYLADYMIPGKVVIYDKLPLNSNGKIDRQKLKETFM